MPCAVSMHRRCQPQGPADTCVYALYPAVPILYSCCWSPDGRQLAASAASGEVLLYDVAKGGATRRYGLHTRAALHVSSPALRDGCGQQPGPPGSCIDIGIDCVACLLPG
jgi:hypothetical protein